jgi:hypothetical protein
MAAATRFQKQLPIIALARALPHRLAAFIILP